MVTTSDWMELFTTERDFMSVQLVKLNLVNIDSQQKQFFLVFNQKK